MQNNDFLRTLTAGEFQRQCFEEVLDFLKQLGIKASEKAEFTKREPTELLSYDSIDELHDKCVRQMNEMVAAYPELDGVINGQLSDMVEGFYDEDVSGLKLLEVYGDFSQLKAEQLDSLQKAKKTYLEISASKSHVFIRNTKDELPQDSNLTDSMEENCRNKNYLSYIMRICKDARERSRDMKATEMCGIWSAYTLIKKGTTLDFSYKGLGTSGFRNGRHTLIFTTDPGDDHIRVTSRSKALMDGIAAHVEHIDRDKISSKELVEAYRLPAAINAAKVRLHIGDSVPVTAFIGRPVFENGNEEKNKPTQNYEMDALKSVHMSASACSAMFQNGIADCKIAIERMYLKDAVSFMKGVVGNVLRTQGKQTLAAAFNLNTAYYDDLYHPCEDREDCYVLTDPYEIAQTAIKVAVDGGFDRVTWDGASNQIPSKPIIDQLSHEQFVTLVHTAHENGLQTYFSAGLEAEHVERCVYTAVDGLGIGTSLHYIDPDTKLMGAFNPDKIKDVLNARNKAEATVKGRGAVLLAKLDRLYFEKLLTDEENKKRNQLFEAVCEQDEDKISEILKNSDDVLTSIINMEDDGENTIVERGKRTLRYVKSSGKSYKNDIKKLQKAVENEDIDTLNTIFNNIN
jgi:hypothetical protein